MTVVAGSLTVGATGAAANPRSGAAFAPAISCPAVADRVDDAPARAQAEVQRNLQQLETQIADANRRLASSAGQGGSNFVRNAILSPLKDKRAAALRRIEIAFQRAGARAPQGLDDLATCTVQDDGSGNDDGGQGTGDQQGDAGQGTGDQQGDAGQGTGDQQGDSQGTGDQQGDGQDPGDQQGDEQGTGDQQGDGQDNSGQDPGGQGDGDQQAEGQGNADQDRGGQDDGGQTGAPGGINCPTVADRLGQIPARARAEVQRNLRQLETQIAEANRRLKNADGQAGTNFVRNAVLGPLKAKRTATLQRIALAFQRAGARVPAALRTLATCEVRNPGGGGNGDNGDNGGDGGQARGPVPEDFVDIRSVRPNVNVPRTQRNGSRGTFSVDCGRNEGRIFNSDNVIVAPGVSNGAQHTHDYVGNESTNNQSTNESLLAAGTTCRNGDKSTHYWPVVRALGQEEFDANQRGGGLDLNVGKILTPAQVQITFKGNPTAKVVPAPQFLRIITGNARVGGADPNAGWTCTGFENRQLTDKYPLCPRGSRLVRVFDFQSCWDGQNIDSANHRTHVTFPQADGSCPQGFQPIPALQHRLVYNVPRGPNFAVDGFPEELHKPITDHSDFINLMNEQQMGQVVNCINSGRRCR
ncbi:DUF1996 domain-containing protein [Nonomuraea fuscirosea]|uniref:DUF1996 domain-containing protein n=1 Tax=Nonomuraea fuscirosea TaxID=1291556 RepID=UPI001C631288|nr:DUF1996 domain-containing protein [Nonomuraea fuscirosea]